MDPLEVLGLAEQHQVGVAARADQREGAQQVASAKSSQAAMNSRLSLAPASSSSRRQAGSTFRNVYLTKWRVRHGVDDSKKPGLPVTGLAATMRGMRIALVSPYSWTYPGGVTRHIEALAEQLHRGGHHVRVLAPFDPPGRVSAVLHRGARPAGARRARLPGDARAHRRLQGQRRGLEPVDHPVRRRDAPARAADRRLRRRPHPRADRAAAGWLAADWTPLPLVGTFHSYSAKRSPTGSRTCSARGGCSTACTCGSPSRRRPRGRPGAASAATTG